MDSLRIKIIRHIYASWWIYLLVGSCFLVGVFFGFLGMNALEESQTSFLRKLFEDGLTQLEGDFNFSVSARQAVMKNIINLGKIFLLGLTIIGLPLILIIIFTRGFVLGFTIDFLLQGNAWKGGVFTVMAIVPPNLLSLPAYILGAVAAINFSLYLMKGQNPRKIKLSQYLSEYFLLLIGLGILMLGAALIEGYFSPAFIRLLQ